MARSFDVIVVGVGAMGSSTCYHLARRGVRVLGLEQFDIPHALGSSHGQSRMIRQAYYEHPDYVPLLRGAYALWEDLESVSGQKLLYITGGLYLGPPGGGLVEGSLQSARAHVLEHELLAGPELTRRFPQFRVPEHWVGVHEAAAGFLGAERAVAAYAQAALRLGAELHGRETVLDWSAGSTDLTVRTNLATYSTDRLVFCGGAWTGKLLADLGVPLRVTRQVMGWVWPRDPVSFELGRFPVWATDNPDGTLYYGFPLLPDTPGLKLAWHGPGPETDPDRVARDALPGDDADFRAALAHLHPDADGPTLARRVCLYTNSPDHHFILDRHPRDPRVSLACGFSGHGFKFASVVGEIMADLALEGRTAQPAQFLGLKRFDQSFAAPG